MCEAPKMILFGGTFDPPHNGHVSLLAGAVARVQPSNVIIMPTGIPPHKASGYTPAALRLAMCQCFCPLSGRVEISDMEIMREGKSFTIDTVRTLLAQNPGARIYLPMGSDMLLYFRKWKDWRALAQLVTLVVGCRAQEDIDPVRACIKQLVAEGAHIEGSHGYMVPVSSTEVREKVMRGEDISALVPPRVAQIIVREGLYRL